MRKYTRFFLLFKIVCFCIFFTGMNMYTQKLIKNTTKVNAHETDKTEVNALENKLTQLNQDQGNSKKIYIYSTHQQEEYVGGNVKEGSRYLAKVLENMGYQVIVEENDFEAYGASKGLNYNKLYNVSNTFLTEAIVKHGGFDLIIDFHRDSISKESSTFENYAKMMMVVSMSNPYHEEVEANSRAIREAVEALQPHIMRSDYKREYAYYNQQYAHSMVLIEVGGLYNTYEEVTNSLDILALGIDDALKKGMIQ